MKEELDYEPPNYNINVNISPLDVGELDWDSHIRYLFKKLEGQVPIPAFFYDSLLETCRYNCSAFLHYN